jgi:predicted transcriptional regulator
MGKNRDSIGIIAAILESANGGSTKTHIMFGANLSFGLLEKYLTIAMKSGFIRYEDNRYHLTKPGHSFLKEYKSFEARYVSAQKMLEGLCNERDRFARYCEAPNGNKSARSLIDVERF